MAKPKTCRHIFGDGDTCGAVALRDETYCYFHLRYKHNRQIPTEDGYEFPVLEDRDAVQLLVSDIMRGILKGKIDTKMANSLLYATQIAAGNVSRWKKVPDDASTGQAENNSKPKEKKAPIMMKLLTEALADLELESPSGDIRPAREVLDEKIKEAVASRQ